ncbi:MAG: hypothetical protein M3R51_07885, partial [Candidatus Eremiobacteraeota bacterium]|nr:hypothetical protein [Candidatus Eremiobacteraeota bacterium]
MKDRRFGFAHETLLSPADAIAAFFAAVSPISPSIQRVSIDDAYGRVLGERIVADRDYPDAPRSAMDGFAVASASVPGRLAIAGTVAMGSAWNGVLARGSALHIATGGVVPAGADAVVPV